MLLARALLAPALLSCFSCFGLLGCASADGDEGEEDGATAAEEISAPITNFHTVRAGLYRGARPGAAGLTYLKKLGVKTIVDLETTGLFEPAKQSDIDDERIQAKALGIKWIAEPMSSYLPVKDARVDAILALLADPSRRPLFVHCSHGQDRVGLIVGLERVEQEGWTPQHAWNEMRDLGFHPILENLNHYFEERTGFEK